MANKNRQADQRADQHANHEPESRASSSNRSLARGLELLRAFGPGATLLGNGDLAERTGLPKATVSRLAQTLVKAGYLEHDAARRAYRLGLPVLSLAQALRSGSTILNAAGPLIRDAAQTRHINVGIAGADREEMVYLESIRYNQRASLRTIVSGQRVPMELTSLGRAYLAMQPEAEFARLMHAFKRRGRSGWERLAKDIAEAANDVHRYGYCVASWQPEVIALATPLDIPGHRLLVLNFSVRTAAPKDSVARELAPALLQLRDEIKAACERLEG
ncbi:IclR family transcriptional regulator [Paraburkholderia phenoliruptrix]|uniref:IclR family transcriptional regulator n=1 Tax=Paraburkholderia phenoliruptrix TaxID=252970 RepID=A0ABV3WET6_9BURK|nr:helix-turn-helix domain-containing protein [Paraburkholderia phenoliruptrix]